MKTVGNSAGKMLGVVGFGGIGRRVAKLAQGLGMKVLATDPAVAADAPVWRESGVAYRGLYDLLAESDAVTLHVPLVRETRHLLSALGVALAVLVNRSFRGQTVVQGILIVPMITSPVAVGTIWYLLYNSKIGPLTYFVERLGFGTQDWLGVTATALPAIILADIWEWIPFVFLLALSGLQGIPEDVIEAARIDGAGGWRLFRFVTFPMLRGVIVAAGILRAMDAFKIFDTIFIMTGGGPGRSTESASLFVYRTAFTQFEFGYAAAMVIVVRCLPASLYWLYTRIPQEV